MPPNGGAGGVKPLEKPPLLPVLWQLEHVTGMARPRTGSTNRFVLNTTWAAGDGLAIRVVRGRPAGVAVEDVVRGDGDRARVNTTARQLESAVEGYRVARELFSSGRATSTTLIDAEIVLAQSRFEHLNALVDARLGCIRLDYAVGRAGAVASR